MWQPPVWFLRKPLAVMVLMVVAILSISIFVAHPRLWTGVLGLLGLYRAFNLSRIVKGRKHEHYLRRVTFRTSLLLIIFQLLTLGLFRLTTSFSVDMTRRWELLAALQLLLAIILLLSTLRHVRTTREPIVTKSYPDRDLPTLTVAIPARNETDDLEACIASLVASDYPKLEVLVLDDCSSNAKTPEIIRSFAHAGVRFVSGSEPEDTWLAKNWAYERLVEEANGALILFCGVDTRFKPSGLRRLVATLLEKEKSMLSLLPTNQTTGWRSQLIQPMRYAWELSLPRRLFQRPPVLSTCWLIKTDLLKSAGSFKAVSRSVVPEAHFARTAAAHDGYGFVRSNEVNSVKPYTEQWSTAVRTRYPQLHRRPELVVLVSLMELMGLNGPYVLLVVSIVSHWWWVAALCMAAITALTVGYAAVVGVTYRRFYLSSLVLLPFATCLDIYLLHDSMAKYEFSDVVWKGRNVCIPVMHVVPRLPAVPR